MSDNWRINPAYPEIKDEPIKSSHDITTTRQSVKELLAHGTPDWVKYPEDYRAFVKESFQAEHENSCDQVAQYKMPGQEILADRKPRMINAMASRDFIGKLRNNGVQCFTFQNPGMPQTVGLWAVPHGSNEARYIAYCQVPAMFEWSVLRLDNHGLPNGEDFRGWRTVLCQLIIKGVLTEEEAHKIFGEPLGAASSIYKRTLYNWRNGIGREIAQTEL